MQESNDEGRVDVSSNRMGDNEMPIQGLQCQLPNRNVSRWLSSIKSRKSGTIIIILVSTLPTKDADSFHNEINCKYQGRRPPNSWISNEINLSMIFAPTIRQRNE